MRTLVAVVVPPLILALLLTCCAPMNLDVNCYHCRPIAPGGRIACAGDCR